MSEEWKQVVGWEGLYEVSNLGRVRSLVRQVHHRCYGGKILTQPNAVTGYKCVTLHPGRKWQLVHRLVAEAFIDNPAQNPQVNHKDGNKKNNIIGNLEWCTASENIKHAFRTGLKSPGPGTEKGEQCPSSKLKESQVREIKMRIAAGAKYREIANDYHVSKSAISEIKAGRSWGHVQI